MKFAEEPTKLLSSGCYNPQETNSERLVACSCERRVTKQMDYAVVSLRGVAAQLTLGISTSTSPLKVSVSKAQKLINLTASRGMRRHAGDPSPDESGSFFNGMHSSNRAGEAHLISAGTLVNVFACKAEQKSCAWVILFLFF